MFDETACPAGRLVVKICGITNADDAHAAIEAGADALGFNCYRKSKRFVELEAASEWIEKLSGRARRIAVLVNPSWDEAIAISRLPCIDALQLHGAETPQFCARLAAEKVCFGKALPASEDRLLETAQTFSTSTIVLDSISQGDFGGTGETFPWGLARQFGERHPQLRLLVAGGLTPDNVAEAIKVARPFGVDVTSGVESAPGKKDHQRLQSFIAAARGVSAS